MVHYTSANFIEATKYIYAHVYLTKNYYVDAVGTKNWFSNVSMSLFEWFDMQILKHVICQKTLGFSLHFGKIQSERVIWQNTFKSTCLSQLMIESQQSCIRPRQWAMNVNVR